ncbi:hypothetical protein EPN15_02185 [Patescibacteria group bacterium]|nr:MAG: hypothetical protein EPN15_02185 [Patescibacteria group bacterium]
MRRKETDPNQLDLFKPQSESTAKEKEKMTRSEWEEPSEEAKQLAREMNPLPGKEVRILNRWEERKESQKVKDAVAELGRKLGIEKYIKDDPQEDLPINNNKK